jgi:catechol 2,3-dioxygenase-like lactoylglutathione lyase family enzyme
MRIDHIAYRVKDRNKTAEFFQKALGYKVQTEFTIDFGDGDTAKCIALEPSEKLTVPGIKLPWVSGEVFYSEKEKWDGTLTFAERFTQEYIQTYHRGGICDCR